MELIRGVTLNKLTPETGKSVLQHENLRQLGALMALDCLTNNRFVAIIGSACF